MRIDNEFSVDAPVERVWDLLTDVEAIAPCLPGARLTGVESGADGDVYSGTVRVKVGPVVAAYEGTARFSQLDTRARRAVIEARGKASRGAGNASASVTLDLRERDGGTTVSAGTDLKVTGRLAQLGGGMIKDVSERLLGQFVENVEAELARAQTEEPAMAPGEPEPAEGMVSSGGEQVEPLDLGRAGRKAFVQRLWPVLAVAVVALGLLLGYVVFS
ncbi:SRPBCC family protein [Nocardiopsis exhalans]|uniref:SRPBCC family protein n=1 Tax=Nocardiopsis exhalans TaxID=163604 RepID=A0ABY5D5J5_9ACTN|nr:SRPBCC family protein [Nocardiopsis exhalans]USY18504.1 SRPBCC family protein [Nocardiopsis exhalans]